MKFFRKNVLVLCTQASKMQWKTENFISTEIEYKISPRLNKIVHYSADNTYQDLTVFIINEMLSRVFRVREETRSVLGQLKSDSYMSQSF